MLKRLLLCLFLLIQIDYVLANPNKHPLIKEPILLIDDLNSKTIFRTLYQNRMISGFFAPDDEDLKRLPYVAIKSKNKNNQQVAVLHPTLTYKNHANENRFLIISEIIMLEEDSNEPISCHACSSDIELYLFKQVNNGYQLVSSSIKGASFGGSWGRSSITQNDNLNVEEIGTEKSGFFNEHGYMGQGFLSVYLDLISLNEDKPIERHEIATIAENNNGAHDENSPLAWGYDSTYKFINNGSAYFPIRIEQKGEAPNKKNKIIKINQASTYYYDKIKNKYIKK